MTTNMEDVTTHKMKENDAQENQQEYEQRHARKNTNTRKTNTTNERN